MNAAILNSDLTAMPVTGPSVFGRHRWRLWVLLSEIALIGAVVAFLYWPILTVANVTYEGPADWEPAVRGLVTLPSDGNILHFVPSDAESRIESQFSDRADAQVTLELPNRISIRMIPFAPRLWGDGGIGIACDGSLLLEPAQHPDLPHWNPGIDWEGTMPLPERARHAAGAWDELTHADRRYELITSEWTCDPDYGWTATAVDGKTRVRLGNTLIEDRARQVAQLFDQSDTLLAKPCVVDARFAGQLILSAIPEPVPDSMETDSSVAANGRPRRKGESWEGGAPAEPALSRPSQSIRNSQSSSKGRT